MKQKDDFEKLFSESKSKLYNIAYGVVKNREHANDVLQDSYIKAWKKFDEFDSNKKFINWMTTIVTNAGIDYNRAQKRKKPTYSLTGLASMNNSDGNKSFSDINIHDKNMNVHKMIEERETISEMLMMINNLPNDLRQIMILIAEGNSYEEIAESVNLSVGTVRSKANQAKKILQKNSEKYTPNQFV